MPLEPDSPERPIPGIERSGEKRFLRKNGWRTQVIRLGKRNIIAHGVPRVIWSDIFHYAMTATWPLFFTAFAAAFVTLNAIFAVIFSQGVEPIANQMPSGFWGAFFFSVETLATVGYGDMHPQTLFGHVVATVEIFVGMSFIALFTGLMFARFSRPRARILFAEHPVIGPVEGVPTLAIRAANGRQNVIIDASARLRLIRSEISREGQPFRRLYDLALIRDQHPIFALGWTLMHVITESSPLYGLTEQTLAGIDSALILTINGVDETTSQTMLSRYSYDTREILWGHSYEDMLFTDEAGADHVDYALFHQTRPVQSRPD